MDRFGPKSNMMFHMSKNLRVPKMNDLAHHLLFNATFGYQIPHFATLERLARKISLEKVGNGKEQMTVFV